MNEKEQFTLDYFKLGEKAWIKKYWGNIPQNIDGKIFSKNIFALKLELSFIDKANWKWDSETDLCSYLVASKSTPEKYDIIHLEHLKKLAITIEKDLSLQEAVLIKSEDLIATLKIGYLNKINADHKLFTYDYFKLGAPEWIKKYKEKIPEIMSPSQFTLYISHYELKQDFIDEHSWRLDHSMILCFLSPQKDGLYDVINVKDKGLTITAGKDLSLDDAINLKAELLFERLK